MFGVFPATFTFALVVLSRVRADAVPGTSVTFAIVFVLVSVALFLRLLVTLRAASTVGGLTRTIGNDLRTVIERHYPLPYAAEDDAPAYDGPSDGEEWKYTRSDARKRPVHPW